MHFSTQRRQLASGGMTDTRKASADDHPLAGKTEPIILRHY
jgi:hypothetical protein